MMPASSSRRSRCSFVAIALLVASLACTVTPAQEQGTWKRIFNGESFAGWDCDRSHWRIEDGAFVGEIPAGETLGKNTWLVWKDGELSDFVLRVKFRLTGAAAANSGIQYRCQVRDVDHVSGYQADLDMGATWLGRIYDEHGRALLVERGTRVHIGKDGKRAREVFAPADQFKVLFRPGEWNEYEITAVGDQVAIRINGTLFSELRDEQDGEKDLIGQLAFQLHSGPQTKIEFKDVLLQELDADSNLLTPFEINAKSKVEDEPVGFFPKSRRGDTLNLGFEDGTLKNWTATGDAFRDQPVNQDGISQRWAGQSSNKAGDVFIGGYEVVQDGGAGTLTSDPFPVTADYGSFLLGGGKANSTRVEILQMEGDRESIVATFTGEDREQMKRVVVDLRALRGKTIAVRLVDENRGGWGHINFDDFRFHRERPEFASAAVASWRSTANPLLQHLKPNEAAGHKAGPAYETLRSMHVPNGFSVQLVAAEPLLHQPMCFCFDARGRLWVVEGHSYPQKRPEGEGLDRVLIFTDRDGDGEFENRKVFCEGLNLVSGMQVGYDGVWIGAAPQLLFIPDRDHDDVPDGEPEVLLDGFGYADTHETINSFVWGPDGWLYGNQGVFNRSHVGAPGTPAEQRQAMSAGVWRFHPTRHEFEVFAHGGSNQWGLDYDAHGEFFMTHCRSRWGTGPTTHVIQGGHYWNQVNGGYAPYVSASQLPGMPHMRNYMLASASYGHGEGGAGRAGSRAVYGGHSHVGTMIYQGDNWPESYRGNLFTHNLHGHQMNQQVNQRESLRSGAGSGYKTWHAGADTLFVADQQYIGVDLQVGPDGAVYISDWYDPRHCHNPNVELWDRGNGRIYRMQYDAAYQPARVDLHAATDLELVEQQVSSNAWFARTARRVIAERASDGTIEADAVERMRVLLQDANPEVRLKALWTLHAANQFSEEVFQQAIGDADEYVRAWACQLAVDSPIRSEVATDLPRIAASEESPLVLRFITSAAKRLGSSVSSDIYRVIAAKPNLVEDHRLTLLLWYGIAQWMEADLPAAMEVVEVASNSELSDYVQWYAAKLSAEGREWMAERLTRTSGQERIRQLQLFAHGIRGMRRLDEPKAWGPMAAELYAHRDGAVRSAAESIGAAFADPELFEVMRTRLRNPAIDGATRRHALQVLSADNSEDNLAIYLDMMRRGESLPVVLPLLGQYDRPEVAKTLLDVLPKLQGAELDAAVGTLTSRPTWAFALLDAIDANLVSPDTLTAFYVRQMASLGNEALTDRLSQQWGQLTPSSAETKHQIRKLVATYNEAPLWAYNAGAGAAHFKKLCANCHEVDPSGNSIAPKLAGSGSKGIEYIVENILDPNAVIGRDFQARVVITLDGRVITGLIAEESETSVTIRTQTDTVTIAKDDIEATRISENSFMPTGLLDSLNERERIELLKYMMSQ